MPGTATQWVIGVVLLVPLTLAIMTIVLVHRQSQPGPPRSRERRGPALGGGYNTALGPARNAEIVQEHLRQAGERPAK